MPPSTLPGLLAALAGCACLYLSSPNQRWLKAPWRAWPARTSGLALLVLAALCLARGVSLLTATFIFMTALMLFFAVLPYLGALRTRRGGR